MNTTYEHLAPCMNTYCMNSSSLLCCMNTCLARAQNSTKWIDVNTRPLAPRLEGALLLANNLSVAVPGTTERGALECQRQVAAVSQ